MNELRPNGESPSVTSLGATAPNEASFAGTGHVGSSHSLGRGASTALPPNQGFAADKTGSSSPQPKSASPMSPPDMKFSIGGDARMSQPQSAVVAGKGSVPIRSDHVGMSASYKKSWSPNPFLDTAGWSLVIAMVSGTPYFRQPRHFTASRSAVACS